MGGGDDAARGRDGGGVEHGLGKRADLRAGLSHSEGQSGAHARNVAGCASPPQRTIALLFFPQENS
jgi:hypothetical protein